MKSSLLFILALWLTQASAFGLYGCYERILYWQAYKMDADSSKPKIAKACAGDSEVQAARLGKLENGRCNFRQFLYYISENREDRAAVKRLPADIENQKTVDILADKLYDNGKGIKGTYKTEIIYENVGRSNVPGLFNAMGQCVQLPPPNVFIGGRTDVNANWMHKALTARARVQKGRIDVRNRDVGYLLRWDFDPEHQPNSIDPRASGFPRELPLMTDGLVPEVENRGRGWQTVDLLAAKQNIEAKTGKKIKISKYINDVDDIVKQKELEKIKDPEQRKIAEEEWEKRGHRANINAITDAKKNMTGGQCSKK
ncbi:hypothetical protein BDV18DRAFT_155698 [Aspergillus unguis]